MGSRERQGGARDLVSKTAAVAKARSRSRLGEEGMVKEGGWGTSVETESTGQANGLKVEGERNDFSHPGRIASPPPKIKQGVVGGALPCS